jgi:hypothetical protein
MNLVTMALQKVRSGFDLPIALALLCALSYFSQQELGKAMVFGKL